MRGAEGCPSCRYLSLVLTHPDACERHRGEAICPADPPATFGLTPRPEVPEGAPAAEPPAGTFLDPARSVFSRAEYGRLYVLRARVLGTAAAPDLPPHVDDAQLPGAAP